MTGAKLLGATAVGLGVGVALVVLGPLRKGTEPAPDGVSTETVAPMPAGAGPAATGQVMGLSIGDSIDKARQILDPLRQPVDYTPDGKEQRGRRILWRLQGTDYEWIMVWANSKGQITRIRGVFRPEARKPFSEVGDLARAITADASTVRWNLNQPDGSPYRYMAQGQDGTAFTVYMFAQEQSQKQHQVSSDDPPPES